MNKPHVKNSREVLAHIDRSKPVHVYRNLHRGCLSVRQNRIVVCHTDNIVLKDTEFIVGEKGRERVRREKKKNVHAYLKGYVCNPRETDELLPFEWEEIYYNPYKCEGFTHIASNKVVAEAKYCDVGGSNCSPDILAFNIGYKNDR